VRARRIDVVTPGREQAHVAPVAHTGRDGDPGLIDFHRQSALQKVDGGRKPDRTSADHGHWKIVAGHFVLLIKAVVI
jgi:hypothetical protein